MAALLRLLSSKPIHCSPDIAILVESERRRMSIAVAMPAKVEYEPVVALTVKQREKPDEVGFVRASAMTNDHRISRATFSQKPS